VASGPPAPMAATCRLTPAARVLPFGVLRAACRQLRADLGAVSGVHSAAAPFPYQETFEFGEFQADSATVIALLTPYISRQRRAAVDKVVSERTFSVVPIVEGLVDTGNLSAVLRSADALGYGAVHCIRNSNKKPKYSQRCSAGADKWLELVEWDRTEDCLADMKENGYHIVVTSLAPGASLVQDVDWTRPTAVVLGNELQGVSDAAMEMADSCAVIPMVGFVESFNISVAAALTLYEAKSSRICKLGFHGDLSEEQQQILKAVLYLRCREDAGRYVKELLSRMERSNENENGAAS
ncbi:unnamed protein product, partial [Ostreobium quekettii]